MTPPTQTAPTAQDTKTAVIDGAEYQYRLTEEGQACITRCRSMGKSICIPEAIEGSKVVELGDNSFSNLFKAEDITCPSCVRRIGDRAFWGCHCLNVLKLNEGLEYIGSEACMHCGNLPSITLPASLENVGARLTGKAGGVKGLTRTAVDVSPQNTHLHIDEHLVVYRKDERGWALVDGSSFCGGVYHMKEGTYKLCKGAFASHAGLTQIVLPEGLEIIDDEAFAGCHNLVSAPLPSTVNTIGRNAFSVTALADIDIPAGCVNVSIDSFNFGPAAQSTYGTAFQGTLQDITVHEGNPLLTKMGHLLCIRSAEGSLEAVACEANPEELLIPTAVTRIAEAALSGVTHVNTLRFHQSLVFTNPKGLLPQGSCNRIVIELDRAASKGQRLDLKVPSGKREAAKIMRALAAPRADVSALLEAYDSVVPGITDELERCRCMTARLAMPLHLSEEHARAFKAQVEDNLVSVCVHLGVRNLWDDFALLADAALLTKSNIASIIDVLSGFNAATAVAHLLQLKRQRFGRARLDYAL